MIDREARNRLAESLRQLASGRISNDEFESQLSVSSLDPAIDAVRDQAWGLYSDLKEHKLTGCDRLSSDDRSVVARWIVFLHSEVEYQWPKFPLHGPLGALLNIVTLGRAGRIAMAAWGRSGDFDVWPFINRSQLEIARHEPRLLAGAMPN